MIAPFSAWLMSFSPCTATYSTSARKRVSAAFTECMFCLARRVWTRQEAANHTYSWAIPDLACSALFLRVCGAVYTHFRTIVYQSVNETKQHEYNINKEGCHAVTASTGIEVLGDEHLWTVCRVVLWPGCEKGTMILNESCVCPAIQAPLGLFIYGDIGYILTPWILTVTPYIYSSAPSRLTQHVN